MHGSQRFGYHRYRKGHQLAQTPPTIDHNPTLKPSTIIDEPCLSKKSLVEESLEELRRSVETLTKSLRATENRLTAVQSSIDDCEFNSRARALNSTGSRREAILHPLRNTTTHQVVELPGTLGELYKLQAPALTELLQALGQEPERDNEMVQLKKFIGISV
ncbi:hypothetical protein O1611_g2750 [Lasiodiplodia mahajangana]|uniref:Uncharacterized protein n=1 Tax=Lasiodiplodia mahajangana TaxID=1108764 RepID=A0ACC2JTN9_9PEZI|nr:hypothetical protein O1611_g2750 [Lasiodiplodia mahajangana]